MAIFCFFYFWRNWNLFFVISSFLFLCDLFFVEKTKKYIFFLNCYLLWFLCFFRICLFSCFARLQALIISFEHAILLVSSAFAIVLFFYFFDCCWPTACDTCTKYKIQRYTTNIYAFICMHTRKCYFNFMSFKKYTYFVCAVHRESKNVSQSHHLYNRIPSNRIHIYLNLFFCYFYYLSMRRSLFVCAMHTNFQMERMTVCVACVCAFLTPQREK